MFVNFEATKIHSKERSSIRSSNRAFERACRGRARTVHDTSGRLKAESISFVIGNGTAIRPKTVHVNENHIEKPLSNDDVQYQSSSFHDVKSSNLHANYLVAQKRSQTVRNNVDKFQIEQVSCFT